jgi:hypothetical protein
MKLSDAIKTIIVRIIFALSIIISIGIMYYVNIIQKDYYVFTNPTGPDMNAE